MNVRQIISFFLATLMGLTSAGAYVPEYLGGEGRPSQASALQVETAILLDEGGVPRCRIGEHPSEYLTAEQLGEFYGKNSQIDSTAFDDLRECDENDEAYARIALGAEEISYGVVIPPLGKVTLGSAGLGVFTGRVAVKLGDYMARNKHDGSIFAGGLLIMIGTISAAAFGIIELAASAPNFIAGSSGIVLLIIGAGSGILFCD